MGIMMVDWETLINKQRTCRQVSFFEKIPSGHSNIWQKAAIYYVDNLGRLLNLSEPQFIDLLNKDNDIYFDEDES